MARESAFCVGHFLQMVLPKPTLKVASGGIRSHRLPTGFKLHDSEENALAGKPTTSSAALGCPRMPR